MAEEEEVSWSHTPTWAVATVLTVMLSIGFLVQGSLEMFGKWLTRTRRKALVSALGRIKDELMVFGLMSLLMGHWSHWVSKFCVGASALSSSYNTCVMKEMKAINVEMHNEESSGTSSDSLNGSESNGRLSEYCLEGEVPLASYENLEQLHRLMFVLGVIHVSYSFVSIALAMLKIYTWKSWENQAKSMIPHGLEGPSEGRPKNLRRLTTFIFHHTSHPWSHNRVLRWVLCFCRQFWSSINRADYMALRFCFIENHDLPLTYDFHNYMLRSLEDEFHDIVGISLPLWVYAISCILLEFHGSHIYFWLSFAPAIWIMLAGTKLHQIVIKLALDVMETNQSAENQFNFKDEHFWFGKPKLLLWIIQLISFQNALEMATFIWSMWEIKRPSCFMENRMFLIIRLTSGLAFQFWCSHITFPLYVIVRQMGSKFKKSVVTEDVRKSLRVWRKRAKKSRRGGYHVLSKHSTVTTSSKESMRGGETAGFDSGTSSSPRNNSSRFRNGSSSQQIEFAVEAGTYEQGPSFNDSNPSHGSGLSYESDDDDSYSEDSENDKR